MPPDLIRVNGGIPGLRGASVTTAQAGDCRWKREADETETAFIERAMREAEALGERRLVIGGLPESEQ
jgi:hypothetical protein